MRRSTDIHSQRTIGGFRRVVFAPRRSPDLRPIPHTGRPQRPQNPSSAFQAVMKPGAETGFCGAYRGRSETEKPPPPGRGHIARPFTDSQVFAIPSAPDSMLRC